MSYNRNIFMLKLHYKTTPHHLIGCRENSHFYIEQTFGGSFVTRQAIYVILKCVPAAIFAVEKQ